MAQTNDCIQFDDYIPIVIEHTKMNSMEETAENRY